MLLMSQLGVVVFGFGAAIYFGEGAVSIKGAEDYPELLDAYKAAKRERREPTLDQKEASHTHLCYLSGGYLMACGAFMYLVSATIGD
jgi:hypothetical protein